MSSAKVGELGSCVTRNAPGYKILGNNKAELEGLGGTWVVRITVFLFLAGTYYGKPPKLSLDDLHTKLALNGEISLEFAPVIDDGPGDALVYRFPQCGAATRAVLIF